LVITEQEAQDSVDLMYRLLQALTPQAGSAPRRDVLQVGTVN
jgi:hypothetical protein